MKFVPERLRSLWFQMTVRERAAFATLGIVLLISAILSITGYIGRNTTVVPQTGGVYREAAVGQPRHLNPILASTSDLDLDITRLVYSSLVKLNRNLELENDLAAGYEISPDQKTYTVKLRSDVVWHDGEAFNADDVIFTIRSIQTPDYASPLLSSFQGVEVEKVDDYTVRFTLQQPYALFLNSLTVGIAPQHVWEDIPPKNTSLAEQILKPVGTGAFKFSEITTRRKTGDITGVTLVRNDRYYQQQPYLDEIDFLFYPTHEEAMQALLSSQVDGVSFLPLQLANDVKWRASYNVHRLLIPQYFALFFNQNKNELLADAGLRSSLALATDRETIVKEALGSEADVLHLPIPPGVFAYHEEFGNPAYNPDAAKQNLEDTGWKDADGDGIREKENKRLHLKITTTDWPEYIRTAELIQQQWLKIGVETEIESLGAGTIQQTAVRPRDY
ncbi:MAG: peptide ABC transporter substrate-binding protein, partial [Patescibacteria group bacterium]